MIWFAWRRQRTQVLVSLGVIALAALLMVLAAVFWLGDGEVGVGVSHPLAGVMRRFFSVDTLVWLPMILGIFAGAPLFAREASRGTHTFVFTQSVSRWRFFAARALMATVPIVVALLSLALLYSKIVVFHSVSGSSLVMSPWYEASGIVLTGYFVLATAIGAVAGLFVKNTIGAMAMTLAVYLLVMIGISGTGSQVVPMDRYEFTLEQAERGEPDVAGFVSYVDSAGDPVQGIWANCSEMVVTAECASEHGAEAYVVENHSSEHFWPMQLVDTAVILAISGALVGIGAWRLRTWHP